MIFNINSFNDTTADEKKQKSPPYFYLLDVFFKNKNLLRFLFFPVTFFISSFLLFVGNCFVLDSLRRLDIFNLKTNNRTNLHTILGHTKNNFFLNYKFSIVVSSVLLWCIFIFSFFHFKHITDFFNYIQIIFLKFIAFISKKLNHNYTYNATDYTDFFKLIFSYTSFLFSIFTLVFSGLSLGFAIVLFQSFHFIHA
jgi:hypothetical protein